MDSPYSGDLDLAHQLANLASEQSLPRFRTSIRQWRKSDGTLATEADLAVEDALRSHLAVARPDDAVLGEERGQTGEGRRRWIIDGIDGTLEFAAGEPDWGTLIALEDEGRVMVGVCDEPARSNRRWAVRGGVAYTSHGPTDVPRTLAVSATATLRQARGFVPPPRYLPTEFARRVAETISRIALTQPLSGHPGLQVAAGELDFAVFMTGGHWDFAAPSVIVEAAGGRFSDLSGGLDMTTRAGVFSNGRVHDELLALISKLSTP